MSAARAHRATARGQRPRRPGALRRHAVDRPRDALPSPALRPIADPYGFMGFFRSFREHGRRRDEFGLFEPGRVVIAADFQFLARFTGQATRAFAEFVV